MTRKNSGNDSLGIGSPSEPVKKPSQAAASDDKKKKAEEMIVEPEQTSEGKRCPQCKKLGRATSTRERYTWYKCRGCNLSYKVMKDAARFRRGMRMDGTYGDDDLKKKNNNLS